MQELCDLANKCAATASATDVDDLPSLAQLHTDLRALCLLAANGSGGQLARSLNEKAERAAQLVEKLVLRDVRDALAALNDLRRQLHELQQLAETQSLPPPATIERVISESDAQTAMDFVNEATGHLDAAEATLLKLEEDPSDADQINAVFRGFHTIKGAAGFLELKQIGALAHATETLLDQVRKGKVQ
ncbi:MAG TPA: Hpt domain-containing protein, partial [Tepidisphaeraceae bacterium]|nr:Hpt domain-containing protein [Tepidisphaeraceae bacterium]